MDRLSLEDDNILKPYGGINVNNLVNFFEFENDEDEPTIMNHSPYHSTEDILKVFKQNNNDFILLTLNAQSIRSKFSQLQILLHQLSESGIEIGAFCIQETWIAKDADTTQLQLEGYTLISQGYSATTHGGLFIYVNSKYTVHEFYSINSSTICEALFIKLENGGLPKDIIIGNVYKPPHDNNNKDNIDAFIEEMNPVIDQINASNLDTFCAGDFNIDLLKMNIKEHYSSFLDMMVHNSLFPKITLPTRFSKKSCSLLDNIFCKFSNRVLSNTSGILLNDISDHLLCFVGIKLVTPKDKNPPRLVKQKINLKKANESLLNDLNSQDIYSKMIHSIDHDPNDNYKIMSNIISETRKKYFPNRLVKFNKKRHKASKWITYGIINSMNKRDEMYRDLKAMDPNHHDFLNLKQNLSVYNKILKKNIREAKTKYYHAMFDKHKNDVKNTWKLISEIFNKCNKKKNSILKILVNGTNITNPKDIANEFNSFFANIGPLLASKIDTSNKRNFQSYLQNTITSKFNFTTVDKEEILKIIMNLKSKTSFGHDDMTTKSLKMLAPVLLETITLIVNQSLVTGIFPDDLKLAKVIPLHKKADTSKMDNYRPVSLLPAISKIFEKVAHTQLYKYFKENDLFFRSQYGFRDEHSTEFAALELIDHLHIELDKKNIPEAIYMDLSKAFDTLDHDILLHKLKYYGVNGPALSWFDSYLKNRNQYVEIGGIKSVNQSLRTGVPQGSVLGPLLFLIYMNDIPNASSLLKFILFADDTSLLDTINLSISPENTFDSEKLNKELSKIYDWLAVNKLSLNISKTKFMIFHHRNKSLPKKIEIKINNTVIERVQNFCFLGLTINENLSWKTHLNNISNKVSKYTGVLNNLKHFLPVYILRTLYCSLIQSHFSYCILAWGSNSKTMEKIQKKVIRIITCSRYNAHTEPLFKALNLLKIEHLYKINLLKFYYKLKNQSVPLYFNSFNLDAMRDIHDYNTRSNNMIPMNVTRTHFAQNSLRNVLPSMINDADNAIISKVHTHSYKGFCNYAKKSIIENYSEVCAIQNCYICNRP